MTTILLFFILLGVTYLIWKPLVVLVLIGFLFKYWHESHIDSFSLGGYYNSEQYEHPEDLLECKICKVYFHKDDFQEHVLRAAINEQESINEMSFLSFMLARNRHKKFYSEALGNILKVGGQYKIDNNDGTEAVIKGNFAKLADKKQTRQQKR